MRMQGVRKLGTAIITSASLVAALANAPPAEALSESAQKGEELFRKTCFACHTVGGGRLVGPDLRGVTDRRREEWLIQFVKSSAAMISAGDPEAVAVFKEHFEIPMPPQALTDDEIRYVLAFCAEGEFLGPAALAEEPAPPSEEQVALGRALFQGTQRLANGGPTCNSCHEVAHDAVIGGGILARELTTVFSRLGGDGVRSILGTPPFPVMERAYTGRSLTNEEQAALLAFLEDADTQHAFQQPRDYGVGLFVAGAGGAAGLLGLYTLYWRRRKVRTVYHSIFDRQVRSS